MFLPRAKLVAISNNSVHCESQHMQKRSWSFAPCSAQKLHETATSLFQSSHMLNSFDDNGSDSLIHFCPASQMTICIVNKTLFPAHSDCSDTDVNALSKTNNTSAYPIDAFVIPNSNMDATCNNSPCCYQTEPKKTVTNKCCGTASATFRYYTIF